MRRRDIKGNICGFYEGIYLLEFNFKYCYHGNQFAERTLYLTYLFIIRRVGHTHFIRGN